MLRVGLRSRICARKLLLIGSRRGSRRLRLRCGSSGGNLGQSVAIPPELVGTGFEAERAGEYLHHCSEAVQNCQMDTRALEEQTKRMSSSSHKSIMHLSFWKETCLMHTDPVVESVKYFHVGSEVLLLHFVALPFVRRHEALRRQLKFLGECMPIDALQRILATVRL